MAFIDTDNETQVKTIRAGTGNQDRQGKDNRIRARQDVKLPFQNKSGSIKSDPDPDTNMPIQ